MQYENKQNRRGGFPKLNNQSKMKTTQKQVIEFFKNTQGECAFAVFSFDKKDGSRVYGYGGYNFFDAFKELTQELAKGLDVVLTDKRGWDYCNAVEIKRGERVTYGDMLPFAIKIDAMGSVRRGAPIK